MGIKLVFIFLFVSISAVAGEDFVVSKSIVNAYNSCLNLKIDDAKIFLIEDKSINKNNGFRFLIENYIDAISLLIEDDPVFYKVALARKSKRLENLTTCNQESVFYNYVLSDIHLHWALIRLKFGDQIKAVNELRLAAKYNKLNEREFPTFMLNNKNSAIIQAIASSIPPKFSWIGKQLSIEGTIESALSKIDELRVFTRINKQYHFLNAELNLINLFIQINLSGISIEKIDLVKLTEEKEFNSLIVKFYLSINLLKQGESGIAKRLIEEISYQKNGIEFNYLNYLLAEISMNTKLNDFNYIDIFLSKYKGSSYIKSALRKKAWLAILEGNIKQYNFLMNRILKEGEEHTDDDKQAMLEAESKVIPHPKLISSRLYFDGGEYELSLQQLSLIDFKELSIENKSEFFYRRGRCYQRLNLLEKAQSDFNNSIEIAKLSNPYILAVSCFYQAQIYEYLENKNMATKYYTMVLNSKQHSYKNSLDAKSKAALQRLNITN